VNTIILAVIVLSAVGLVFAIIIYGVDLKFQVFEDPKIDVVAEFLPGANCGGCGYAGCRNFAEAIVKAGNMDSLFCPVGGNAIVKDISAALGIEAVERAPQVAVIRCNGSLANAPQKIKYDGVQKCSFAHSLSSGETGCPNGCLGLGDCVESCQFDAMYMDKATGLPIIIEDKCTSCGACVKSCPRKIIELRNKGPKSKRIFVSCVNTEKGVLSKKNCAVACIGCGKCVKACPHDAITLVNNLAYINFEKCKLCRKCVTECPTAAIWEINFPARKAETAATENENSVN